MAKEVKVIAIPVVEVVVVVKVKVKVKVVVKVVLHPDGKTTLNNRVQGITGWLLKEEKDMQ